MNSIINILSKIKEFLPYLLLIAIYFFCINLEVRNDKNNNQNIENDNLSSDFKNNIEGNKLRVTIPVVPYNQ